MTLSWALAASCLFFSLTSHGAERTEISLLKPGQAASIDMTPAEIVALFSVGENSILVSGKSTDDGGSLASAFADLASQAAKAGYVMGRDFDASNIIFSLKEEGESSFAPLLAAFEAEAKHSVVLKALAESTTDSGPVTESVRVQYEWVEHFMKWQTAVEEIVARLKEFESAMAMSTGKKLDLRHLHFLKSRLGALPLNTGNDSSFEVYLGVLVQDRLKGGDLLRGDAALDQLADFYERQFGEAPEASIGFKPKTKIVLNPMGLSVPPREAFSK